MLCMLTGLWSVAWTKQFIMLIVPTTLFKKLILIFSTYQLLHAYFWWVEHHETILQLAFIISTEWITGRVIWLVLYPDHFFFVWGRGKGSGETPIYFYAAESPDCWLVLNNYRRLLMRREWHMWDTLVQDASVTNWCISLSKNKNQALVCVITLSITTTGIIVQWN